ncbi:DUF202 domain-containing protein [Acinetobacter qingfengensis]|uniref:DUF202 domain-containing protein n=1 Tax=Acinetobacter qingfengensis TaxID=1262585 RepID=A0A1E7RFC6_9GAMM|nr:DUF202 domain-containing protein [Acinetobacter qingfengensis]KAA8731874.1 DUF202 domain-containing protein [Acinetobacter qingfengensis]OEY98003.1 hypothetical protein BJI46_00270 [Acinetobacter qingfengensis]
MSNLTDPRVLLALERTLLAWIRSALALIAFGFLIERSTLLGEILQPAQYQQKAIVSKIFAVIIVVVGMVVSVWSVRQYQIAFKSLNEYELIPGYKTSLVMFIGWFNVFCGVLLLITFFI